MKGEVALAMEWLAAVEAREEQGELIFAALLRQPSLLVQQLIGFTLARLFLLPKA